MFSRPITGPSFGFMPYEEVEIPARGSVDHPPTYKNHVCKRSSRKKKDKTPQGGFFSEKLKTVTSVELILSNT